jgi:hypothetical protein
MAAGDIVRVTANCGLAWTGRRHAWDGWFSDRRAYAHDKGRDDLTITLVEPDPQDGEHDHDWAGPGFTRPGPEPALDHRGNGRQAEACPRRRPATTPKTLPTTAGNSHKATTPATGEARAGRPSTWT